MRKKRTDGHLALALPKCRRFSLITCCDTATVQCNGAAVQWCIACKCFKAPSCSDSFRAYISAVFPLWKLGVGRKKEAVFFWWSVTFTSVLPRPTEVSRVPLVQPTRLPRLNNLTRPCFTLPRCHWYQLTVMALKVTTCEPDTILLCLPPAASKGVSGCHCRTQDHLACDAHSETL